MLRRKSIDWVENTIKAEGIECKFERVDGYLMPYIEQDDGLRQARAGDWRRRTRLITSHFRCCSSFVSWSTLSAWASGWMLDMISTCVATHLRSPADAGAATVVAIQHGGNIASCTVCIARLLLRPCTGVAGGPDERAVGRPRRRPEVRQRRDVPQVPRAGDFHPVSLLGSICWRLCVTRRALRVNSAASRMAS